ncbi:MAG: hypothetical protein HKP03_06500 [Xanthomonadales bacterium]|nr:hypothetical protein [Xanthomonadales bacterium]NNK38113.1 hypothetical protein [Xanthomonadales bacterium]
MSRWLEENPVGIALAAACAGLVVVALLLGVIWSMPPSATRGGETVGEERLSLDIPSLADSESIERYAVITERPVFNPSRQPQLDIGEDGGEDEEVAEEDVDAPEVLLAGVVITPSLRMATLRPKDGDESLVAFEGQPLEGDFGSWHVSSIEPRRVTLASGSGEELKLSLEVHDQPITAPEKPVEKAAEVAAADGGPDDARGGDQPLTRAEEIRQRIAERREELRRAAEEEEGASSAEAKPDPQANYRSVIQSMISGNNRKRNNDEDEQ